jgi:bifunctional DNA-binding transcriptional regulator/antitoxin component of YhaV-PrlF toxin-antitoxin module
MVKIQKLPSGQLVITIPKLLAEYEGLKRGMEMEFKKHIEGFILKIKRRGG